MSKLPIEARWANRSGEIALEVSDRPFSVAVDDRGSHLSVTLTRLEAEQVRASLADLLSITRGGEQA
jgi:hypothetical protein